MTRHDWSELLIKLFASYQIFAALSVVPAFLAVSVNMATRGDPEVLWWFLTPATISVIFPLILGFLLWRKAKVISNLIWGTKKSKSIPKSNRIESFNLKRIILAAIGIFVLITNLPSWLSAAGDLFFRVQPPASTIIFGDGQTLSFDTNRSFIIFTAEDYIYWLAAFVQIALCFVLILSPVRVIAALDNAQETWDLIVELKEKRR